MVIKIELYKAKNKNEISNTTNPLIKGHKLNTF